MPSVQQALTKMALGDLKKTVASFGFFLIICFLGALGMMFIEYAGIQPTADSNKSTIPASLNKNVKDFLRNHSSHNWTSMEVNTLLLQIAELQRNGGDKQFKKKYWKSDISWSTYTEWQYFTVITLSTIGYGDITPETDGGKIFAILFVMIGIPIHMYMVASAGVLFSKGFIFLRKSVETKLLGRKEHVGTDIYCFLLCLFVAMLYVVTVGLLGATKEGWSNTDGIYWAFVTFSTIGYGDIVPAWRFFPIWFGTVGLVLVAMSYNTLMKALQNKESRDMERVNVEQQVPLRKVHSSTSV